jgi:hypothetical protein
MDCDRRVAHPASAVAKIRFTLARCMPSRYAMSALLVMPWSTSARTGVALTRAEAGFPSVAVAVFR